LGRGVDPVGAPRGEDHVVAGPRPGEPDRRGGADPAAGPGDDGDWLHVPALAAGGLWPAVAWGRGLFGEILPVPVGRCGRTAAATGGVAMAEGAAAGSGEGLAR